MANAQVVREPRVEYSHNRDWLFVQSASELKLNQFSIQVFARNVIGDIWLNFIGLHFVV